MLEPPNSDVSKRCFTTTAARVRSSAVVALRGKGSSQARHIAVLSYLSFEIFPRFAV